jgi:hypothetical protein
VHEHPIAAALGALAAGFLVALAIPGTRREDELFGASRDRLMESIQGATRDALSDFAP